MRLRVALFGGLGALATALAAGLAVAPDLVTAVGPVAAGIDLLAGWGPKQLLLVGAAVAGLYAVVAAWIGGRDGPAAGDGRARFDAAVANPPEAVTADRRRLAGEHLDARIERGADGDPQSVESVRTALSADAAAACAATRGVTTDRARDLVRSGQWTDDRLAAAFLASDEGPNPSPWARLRLVLVPTSERTRRIDRTVAAIDRLVEGGDR